MNEPRRDRAAATQAQAAAGEAGNVGVASEPSLARLLLDSADKKGRVADLEAALRRARIANAERADSLADLRAAELARLEILREHLAPALAQLPKDCDLFDVGIAPGERPRLFIDHLGFVEMGRDRRAYRLLQDTRHGRVTLAESESLQTIIEAIIDYIAHRLIERERALASDFASRAAEALPAKLHAPEKAPSRAWAVFLFVIEGMGAASFFALLAALGLWLYRTYFAH